MKKFQNIKILSFLFFIGLIATSCVHDDDFNIPDVHVEEPNVNVNTSIASVKAMYRGFEPVQINLGDGSTEPMYLEAYVSSDDESGNIFKQLFIQDAPENPTAGVVISTQATGLYTKYGPGQKIYFRVDGLYIGEYNGLPTIGVRKGTDVDRMEIDDFQSRILRSNTVTEIVPTVITIAQAIDASKLATLVKFENVQFPDNLIGEHYGNINNNSSVNRLVEDCGHNTIILRNSGYSKFKNQSLPTGKGSLVSILSVFGNDAQLLIRDPQDVQMDGTRCDGGGGGGNPGDGPSPDAVLAFPGADFENWQTFLNGLNNFGIKSYATHGVGRGMENGNSLNITTDPTTTDGNDYVFTTRAASGLPSQYSKISFYIKGSSSKSVSLNVYKTDNTFTSFNVGDLTSGKTLVPAENNQYTGTINTNGEWVLVTLDISSINNVNVSNTSGDILAVKIGKNSNYDLDFDNFTIE